MNNRTATVDRGGLDVTNQSYVVEKQDNHAWWFQWCADPDPLTFWDRRIAKRRSIDKTNEDEE
jgi:hypothetical protein